MNNICLNMIVKNEAGVIRRCLASVAPYVDSYCIVDTGSTDGTPEIVGDFMRAANVPGELHHREWVDFAHNRQQAMNLAIERKLGPWLLFIDADEELGVDSELTLDPAVGLYEIETRLGGGMHVCTGSLVNTDIAEWKWVSPVHEYLQPEGEWPVCRKLNGAWIQYNEGAGSRSFGKTRREKYMADAAILERTKDTDTRSAFMLARSYQCAGECELAYGAYKHRVTMPGGFEEERWWSQFEVGRMGLAIGRPIEECVEAMVAAHRMRPTRPEPLVVIARLYNSAGAYTAALTAASAAAAMPVPQTDRLFVDTEQWEEAKRQVVRARNGILETGDTA